jgi:tRNA (guanine37-N1)-methyltransferase
MRIAVVTLFPGLMQGALEHGVLGRAQARGLAAVGCVDPRQYAGDAHRTVDDRPYGGGPGMVGTPPPWAQAIDAARGQVGPDAPRIHLSAQGERFDEGMARELAAMPGFVLVASRYEGLDQRVIDDRIDRELSIGDYVLSGGEFAALVVIDAVVRLLPGVLGDERSSEQESYTAGRLDWPHYTRPVDWEGRAVPKVLQGGDHAAIRRWRLKQAVGRTYLRRPDLLQDAPQGAGLGRALSDEERALLKEFLAEREEEGNGQRNR